jgi:hypothetical protein
LAGSDLGLGLEALEDGDLVAQLLEDFRLLMNDLQQPLHQWRLLGLRNDRDRDTHALYGYELSASSSPDLLRCYVATTQPLNLSYYSTRRHPLSSVPPAWLEHATGGLENRCDIDASFSLKGVCDDVNAPLTSSLLSPGETPIREDLARIVDAWGELPLHIRMTIRSLIDATKGDKVGEAGPTRGPRQAGQG